ncbi:T-SNARE affecting protein [Wickerhamomyces ciferrii]|uniref:t-SNARE affecting protein n=1 Tax=Wickerhamomyces ciferrii (strain ATCC 14091 / BCRC 22168 / CBS 111 / JCM 3599 / NBRC 0793 / NRRL Y-1031 F-60-10) TaxID=1206466 RepID=K0KIX0_WICCF|nr:T-SNARE affecting protein [Wickerhamomyces ciferrii]CCH41384.1 T-SNARE affecting protein [Wickerhamomyces ciferrii]
MFRDRTNLFISYRRTYPHHSGPLSSSRFDSLEEEEELIGGDGNNNNTKGNHLNGENIELVTLPPSILDTSEQIDESLDFINDQIDKLNALYKKNLLPGFNDRTIDEEQIEKLNYSITTKFFQCNNLVKKFEAIKRQPGNQLKADDLNMIENMQKNYALKIQQLSSTFRKLQNNYIKFLKKDDFQDLPSLNKTQNKIDNSNYNPAIDETEELESYSKEAIKESSSILQQKSNINDSMIRQREQEITKLAQGVLEVSAIFKEMQNMVIDQGTILDRIDYNLENTKVDLQNASQQLNRAQHYQKRTQKCKIILLLSLIVFLLFMIVILKPHKNTNSSPKPTTPPPNDSDNNNNNSDADKKPVDQPSHNDVENIPEKDKTEMENLENNLNDDKIVDTDIINNRFMLI